MYGTECLDTAKLDAANTLGRVCVALMRLAASQDGGQAGQHSGDLSAGARQAPAGAYTTPLFCLAGNAWPADTAETGTKHQ